MTRKALLLYFLLLSRCAGEEVYASCLHDCHVDETGITFIKSYEGYNPFIYRDIAGVRTIGFGHALLPSDNIKPPLVGEQAVSLLTKDINERTGPLNGMIEVPLEAIQFDALASFSYNVGLANLRRSTLLKYVNARRDPDVHSQFILWVMAGGKPSNGLLRRREGEANMYDEGIEHESN